MIKNENDYILDNLLHKSLLLKESIILFEWLCENNKQDIAQKFAKNCFLHDVSKFNDHEYSLMSSIFIKNDSMKNPNCLPTNKMKKALKLHWKSNRHHPEHFKDINSMKELDILEMVCDWSARSCQYKTDLLDFAKTRLNNRFFDFNKEKKDLILFYCNILSENKT